MLTKTFNTRNYALMREIAQNAWKTIDKIRECAHMSQEAYGHPFDKRADQEFIFFDIRSLIIICYDYTFAAWENFLEHIGYILFDDWDSKKEQRHYSQKTEKLLKFDSLLANKITGKDYEILENKWIDIIKSLELSNYTEKRNPLKHIHADDHDIKIEVTDAISSMQSEINPQSFQDALTDEDCIEFLEKFKENVTKIHSYLEKNKSIFKISQYPFHDADQKIKGRQNLFRTFIRSPWCTRLYTESYETLKNRTDY